MNTTLISLLLAVAFKFDKSGIHWFWSDRPLVAAILVILGVVLGIFWGRAQKDLKKGPPASGNAG